jgi:hypothetical protein
MCLIRELPTLARNPREVEFRIGQSSMTAPLSTPERSPQMLCSAQATVTLELQWRLLPLPIYFSSATCAMIRVIRYGLQEIVLFSRAATLH